jgi:hypothetical protein
LGLRARQYAEANFDIEKIAGQFEAVLTKAAESLPHLTEGIGPRALYRGNLCP